MAQPCILLSYPTGNRNNCPRPHAGGGGPNHPWLHLDKGGREEWFPTAATCANPVQGSGHLSVCTAVKAAHTRPAWGLGGQLPVPVSTDHPWSETAPCLGLAGEQVRDPWWEMMLRLFCPASWNQPCTTLQLLSHRREDKPGHTASPPQLLATWGGWQHVTVPLNERTNTLLAFKLLLRGLHCNLWCETWHKHVPFLF